VLWRRLHELQAQKLSRDELLLKLGVAKKEAEHASALIAIELPDPDQEVSAQTFTFALRKDKLRIVRRREGSYLVRSNLSGEDPAALWRYCILTYRDRAGIQGAQGRLGHSPRLPPNRRTHQGPYLGGLHRLLPAGHLETSPQGGWPRD
jgi:hypothetical protein